LRKPRRWGSPIPTTYPENAPRVAKIPDLLINQIAAGEVVERPASALKELLENSLDALAKRIEVHLRDGGTSEITVIDDGLGIHPEDLSLCLERHATSKIRQSSELESIATYGFRGEALASIASVAEVDLKSRRRDESSGVSLSVHYGTALDSPKPVGTPVGTTIAVRSLFNRLPARLKFLRSSATEFSHCARVVKELAVGNPQVTFSLHHQGRLVSTFSAPTREQRISEAYSWSWKPIHVEEEAPGIAIDAYLSPGDHVGDRGECLLFVNQRPVKNRGLLAAVRQAYLSTLGPHHEPSGVIYLDIRKDWVDVNVHPQKTEVRCLKQETLFSWIAASVRKAISSQPSVRRMEWNASPQTEAFSPPVAYAAFSPQPVTEPTRYVQPSFGEQAPAERVAETRAPYVSFEPENTPQWRYLGQAKAAYLLCEDKDGMILVDQHALHEKIRFEELVKQVETNQVPSQRLLVPRIFRPPTELALLLEESQSALCETGIEVEPFGDGDWAIKTVPDRIKESAAESILIESLKEIQKQQLTPKDLSSMALKPVLATIACHSVVRAGQSLSALEAEALLKRMPELQMGWTCPHGRPVAFRLSFSEIEKHFERK
jgi:DNA mismatch repair protein MutL